MAKLEIMKKIDDFVFKQCTEFKKSQVYSSLTDANANIEDELRPVLNIIMSTLYFFVFIAFILYFFISNSSLKSNIESKELIGEEVSKYIELEKRSAPLYSQLVSNPRIDSESQFTSEVINSVSAGTIPGNKITVQGFAQSNLSENISKITARINFKSLNNEELSNFIKLLSVTKKVQFIESTISRNPQTELVSGTFEILQYSK